MGGTQRKNKEQNFMIILDYNNQTEISGVALYHNQCLELVKSKQLWQSCCMKKFKSLLPMYLKSRRPLSKVGNKPEPPNKKW